MADNAPSPAVARFRIILWTLVVVAAVAATGLYIFRPPSAPVGVTGSPFALDSTKGGTFTQTDLKGTPSLVFFGYTFCPDVCPTELQMMITALGELGKDAARITPVFITIDPARDTPKVIGDYTALFSDRLVGLTGSEAQIAAAARAYRVYYAKAKSEQASSYLMDHSSFIYLMGPDGKLAALFGHDTTVKQLADGLRAKLAGTS
jgi:protein SCO1/2